MGNNAKNAMKRDAASQERVAGQQEGIASEQRAFYDFLKSQGIEDRALQQQIYEQVGPLAETLMGTYNPEEYADLERPSRPDQSDFYTRAYKDELAGIQDLQNLDMSDAADFYQSQGLQRTGVQGRGYGAVRAGADSERTSARTRLSDNLAREEIYGFEDERGAYYDDLSKRGQDVNLSLAGTNILTGQQNTFDPNVSFAGAGGNLGASGGTYGGAGATYGSAASTSERAAQLPSTWSRICGAARAGAGIAADMFAPGSGGFVKRGLGAARG